jgi:1,4-dihydroxy-2-naphthoate polyprenyltransferase
VNASTRSTLQLLRFHFSFFLMPVYWFAVSQVPVINIANAVFVFIILHLLVYPSSNGYNSYQDRDEGSIGGIEKPMKPTRQLLYVTVFMDVIALILSLYISVLFFTGMLLYILASRAYSYRGIRLKKYPFGGYLTVVVFQGAVTFFLVYHGCSAAKLITAPPTAVIAAALLIGGFYPLTQIYQHEADIKDGVKSISYVLGLRGTFIFTGIVYVLAFSMLAMYFLGSQPVSHFAVLQFFMLPVLFYFFYWARLVWKNPVSADFRHTMRMNVLASACTNLAFLTLLIITHHG